MNLLTNLTIFVYQKNTKKFDIRFLFIMLVFVIYLNYLILSKE